MTNEPEVIALAFIPRRCAAYVYTGDDATDYPIRFKGVNVDHAHTIDNFAHQITSRLVGVQYVVAEYESEDGVILRELVKDLEDVGTDPELFIEVLDEYIDRTEEEWDDIPIE